MLYLDLNRTQGISVQEDTVPDVESVSVKEWSTEEAEEYIRKKGGEMNQGDDYASKFMVILPMEELTKDDTKFEISMKADPGSKIYHSKDTKSWQEVKDVYMDEKAGLASFDASEGNDYSLLLRVSILFTFHRLTRLNPSASCEGNSLN